jgi:hypothetical protein
MGRPRAFFAVSARSMRQILIDAARALDTGKRGCCRTRRQSLACTFYTQETGFKDTDTTGTLKGKTLGGIPLQGTGPVGIIH